MKVEIEGGNISFSLSELLEAAGPEHVREIATRLACHDAIIQDVADQIISGWTEDCSHGSRECVSSPDPHTPLDAAIRRVAKASSDVAQAEIERLERELARTKAESRADHEWAWRMFHAWPHHYDSPPER